VIMTIVESLYKAAANAGFLQACVWHPSDGSPAQTQLVGFSAPDETLFDGLAVSKEYVISYPASVFPDLAARELVEIQGMTLQVRDIRSVGDGAECRAKLSRL